MRPADQLGLQAEAPPSGPTGEAPRRRRRRTLLVAVLTLVAACLLVLVLAQLFLPGIAADKVREEVSRYGSVGSVQVSATPAIELIWRVAERIEVRAHELRVFPGDLASLEGKLSGVENAELTAESIELLLPAPASGQLLLRDVRLAKHGDQLTARGSLRAADMHVGLPAGLQVEGLESAGGQPQVGVSGEIFGARISGHALLTAQEGALVAQPSDIPLASLARITIFSNPRIYVESVSVVPQGEGFVIEMQARSR